MQRKRKKRPPELRRSKGGYDSAFERTLHATVLKDWEHHGDAIDYVIEHKYEPDFVKWFGKKKSAGVIEELYKPMIEKHFWWGRTIST